jgi:hypothetical protein
MINHKFKQVGPVVIYLDSYSAQCGFNLGLALQQQYHSPSGAQDLCLCSDDYLHPLDFQLDLRRGRALGRLGGPILGYISRYSGEKGGFRSWYGRTGNPIAKMIKMARNWIGVDITMH